MGRAAFGLFAVTAAVTVDAADLGAKPSARRNDVDGHEQSSGLNQLTAGFAAQPGGRRYAGGTSQELGVEREICTSSSVMSAGMSAKSGVLR